MSRIPVIIDCDPGIDDAAALLLAAQAQELDIKAITTVAGNVGVDLTTRNALRIRHAIGRKDIPVFSGASDPMAREPVDASFFHGVDGFGGVQYMIPDDEVPEERAWDAIYRIAKELDGELVIIAVAPMTNIGLAFAKYKDLPKLVKKIIIMGGAVVGGNATASAEFNIYADPHAADLMFCSGVPVHMCGLDVTMKAYMTSEELEEIGKLTSPQAKLFYDLLKTYLKQYEAWGMPNIALHDPAAIVYAMDESMFKKEQAGIRVETEGKLTLGKTVADVYSDRQFDERIHYAVMDIDREAFISKIMELMAKY